MSNMTTRSTTTIEQETELRAAIQYIVMQHDEKDPAKEMTAEAIAALSEMVYLYATQSLARDLDAFCEHAGRKTINESDVKLVVRKNPTILQKLTDFCQQENPTASIFHSTKKRGRQKAINLQDAAFDDNEIDSDEPSSDEELLQDMQAFGDRADAVLQPSTTSYSHSHTEPRQKTMVERMKDLDSSDEDDGDNIIFLPPRTYATTVEARKPTMPHSPQQTDDLKNLPH